ncbi:hypothetical protein [Halalkalibacter flavus]|uniref:hypothetical protein n=1 Tax=Halalkalibacter flavus TaxID=3090668 RepID=UPI002FC82B9C
MRKVTPKSVTDDATNYTRLLKPLLTSYANNEIDKKTLHKRLSKIRESITRTIADTYKVKENKAAITLLREGLRHFLNAVHLLKVGTSVVYNVDSEQFASEMKKGGECIKRGIERL